MLLKVSTSLPSRKEGLWSSHSDPHLLELIQEAQKRINAFEVVSWQIDGNNAAYVFFVHVDEYKNYMEEYLTKPVQILFGERAELSA